MLTLRTLDTSASLQMRVDDYIPIVIDGSHISAQTTNTISIAREDESCLIDIRLDGSTGQLMSLSLTLYTLTPTPVTLDRSGLGSLGSGVPCFDVASRAQIGRIDRITAPITLHLSEERADLVWSTATLDAYAGGEGLQWLFEGGQCCGVSIALSDASQKEAMLRALGVS